MTVTTTIRIAAAGLVAAGAFSSVALAGGEPKNDWPFTRSAPDRVPAQVEGSTAQTSRGVGEPKNQWPFTRPVDDAKLTQVAGLSPIGEAKNQQPFNQPVVAPTVIASGSGFDWGDAGIGVAAGVGLAAILAGVVLLTYRSQRGRKIGAAAAG